jgi:hypothetical protein
VTASAACETRILTQVLANLAAEPGCALIMPDGSLRGDPAPRAIFWRMNTGKARDTTGRRISFGVPGQADITGAIRGRRVEIELKSDDGAQSPAQRKFQALCVSSGAVYVLARSLEDVMPRVRELLACMP